MYQIEMILKYQEVEPSDILYCLDRCCPKIGLKPEDYSKAHEVVVIEKGGRLRLSGHVFNEIHGGDIGNGELNVLYIKSSEIEIDRLINLVDMFIEELPVVQAFIHDDEYCFWQNAEDVLQYESVGKDHSRLRKVSNGLPYPLKQKVVDIRKNPGRRIFREGFKEVVSSPMWIDKKFIKNIQDLYKLSGVTIVEKGDLLKITSPYNPFDSDKGEQRKLQEALRTRIYKTGALKKLYSSVFGQ